MGIDEPTLSDTAVNPLEEELNYLICYRLPTESLSTSRVYYCVNNYLPKRVLSICKKVKAPLSLIRKQPLSLGRENQTASKAG